jgi:hypothetical protein
MPNEFVARNGFISNNNSEITGSIITTGGIYGNITSASYADTASFGTSVLTASYVLSAITSSYSDYAVTSSTTVTASVYALPSYAPTVGLNTYISPYLCWTETTGAFLSQPIGLDNIVVTPVLINRTCNLFSVGLSFASTASGVPTTASLGLYRDNGSMLPSTLIQSLGNIATTSSTLQYIEVMPAPSISLNAKNIYWLAFVGDAALRVGIPTHNNMLLNPLLGVDVTASFPAANTFISYKNISNYVTRSVGSSTTLPSTLGQSTTTYTIYSYDSASSYIGPIINVTY